MLQSVVDPLVIRRLSPWEAESLLFIPQHYIRCAIKEGGVVAVQRLQFSILGDSSHIGVLAAILGRGLRAAEALPRLLGWQEPRDN